MMKYIIPLVLFACAAHAQDSVCANTEDMYSALAKVNQILSSNAMVILKNKEPALLETYINPKTRLFTIIVTMTNGKSCIVVDGGDYTEYYIDAKQPIDF